MLKRALSMFVVFCSLYNCGLCDCFYIFDVGQGNCQLAVYEKQKIGILYDCGTSSLQERVKISALKHEKYTCIFKDKVKQSAETERDSVSDMLLVGVTSDEADPDEKESTSPVMLMKLPT